MYLHVDLDAFFASVEQLDNPDLKGKPVIVGALPGSNRGVVSTCSYEARSFGVHSAMPIDKAYKLCPQGIFLVPRMKRYHEKSSEVMNVFFDFSPDVKQMSVDEAFIDLSGTEKLFGPPEKTAFTIKAKIKEKTGLTVSMGLASNRYVAKIASGMSKPDGFFYVKENSELDFITTLPLNKIWGIGKKTLEKLNKVGFYTVPQIQKASLPLLESILGKAAGLFLYKAVRGQEAENFSSEVQSKSISAETTYKEDLVDTYIIETALQELAHTVMFRLIKEGWNGFTVFLKIRYEDFSTCSIQETLPIPISSTDMLYKTAIKLFYQRYNGKPIRLLGIGTTNLEKSSLPQQSELFDTENKKKQQIEMAIASLKEKNPNLTITTARLMKATDISKKGK